MPSATARSSRSSRRRLAALRSAVCAVDDLAHQAVVEPDESLAERRAAAIAAGAVAVVELDAERREAFARGCPPLEAGERCPADFVRAAQHLVEHTLAAPELALVRWFLGVADRPPSFTARMPCCLLFRGLGGQAACTTPNIPPELPAGSRSGRSGKIAAKADAISEAWIMGVKQIRASAGQEEGDGPGLDEEEGERLPQNLVPVEGREEVLGNEGSGKFLGWHCVSLSPLCIRSLCLFTAQIAGRTGGSTATACRRSGWGTTSCSTVCVACVAPRRSAATPSWPWTRSQLRTAISCATPASHLN